MPSLLKHKTAPRINWCKVLSAHAHRWCRREDCPCECHNLYNEANYSQDTTKKRLAQLRKVKRIG